MLQYEKVEIDKEKMRKRLRRLYERKYITYDKLPQIHRPITEGTFNKIVKYGAYIPSVELLAALAKAGNTNMSYLLGITNVSVSNDTHLIKSNFPALRAERKVTSIAIAKEFGYSARFVREQQKRSHRLSLDFLLMAAKYTGCSIDYISGLTTHRNWDWDFKKNPLYKIPENSAVRIRTEAFDSVALITADKQVLLPNGKVYEASDSLFLNAKVKELK